MEDAEDMYQAINTDYELSYVDPGAKAVMTWSNNTLQEVALVPVLSTVPEHCEVAGKYTVEYEFSWPGCQCCSCELNESLSKTQTVKAQRTVIVCKCCIFAKHYFLEL